MVTAAAAVGCIGVTVGLRKSLFGDIKKRHGVLASTSGYGYSFRSVIDRLTDDAELGPMLRRHGLSVVVETGNSNDENVVGEFNMLKSLEQYAFLDSISHKTKKDAKALHLADFLAHFSWVYAEKWPAYDRGDQGKPEMDAFLLMIKEGIRTLGNYVEDIVPPWRRAAETEVPSS